ncbi:protein kinase C delta type-like [Megalops cyprinoides]|uniref:protein kinase C delta type-like n=1 Tax=Megalops cyprinoides TaxID=118141 RepID=UPI00186551CF|nr:protein kinase C delta type-like [Megalops cyprinoides]
MEANATSLHHDQKQTAAALQHDLEETGSQVQCEKGAQTTLSDCDLEKKPAQLHSRLSIENFEFLRVLGRGSFGKVMLAEMRGSGEHFAIKVLKKDNILANGYVEYTKVERRVLALSVENPFLTHLYTSFQTKEFLFFVMEYVNGGDLFFHIEEKGRFDLVSTQFYAAEMTCGLQFLHRNGVIYRDLKLDNVMLDREGHIKIADFGLCKDNMLGDKRAFSFCGSEHYIAPEIFQGKDYSFPVDWWSFGVLVFELLTGESPFHGADDDELAMSVCMDTPQYPSWINEESKDFLEKLLERDPTRRLGAVGHIRAHPFFENIDWLALERREVEPPFKPIMEKPHDCRYFFQEYLSETAQLSQCDGRSIKSTDQLAFSDFSFINPKLELITKLSIINIKIYPNVCLVTYLTDSFFQIVHLLKYFQYVT